MVTIKLPQVKIIHGIKGYKNKKSENYTGNN